MVLVPEIGQRSTHTRRVSQVVMIVSFVPDVGYAHRLLDLEKLDTFFQS